MNKKVVIITAIILIALFIGGAFYTGANADRISNAAEVVAAAEANGEDAEVVARQENANILGIWTILPPLVAIALAFVTKQVVISLAIGVAVGVFLVQSLNTPGIENIFFALFNTFLEACTAMIMSLADPWNAGVVMQCLSIGGMIALVTRLGGAKAIAQALSKKAKSVRSATIITELMGCIVFFDDYANSLIVGPVMRPVTDNLKMSREKLSYIVDATAAPVAGIALISTWIATELSAIRQGFEIAGIEGINHYGVFVQTIPFRFYNILTLIFILAGAFMMREFGPMLNAEIRARKYGQVIRPGSTPMISDEISNMEPKHGEKLSIWNAIVPIGILIISSFAGFYYNGYVAAAADGAISGGIFAWETIQTAFTYADASVVLFQAAILSGIVALIMGICQKVFTAAEGISVWVEGVKSLIITAVILVLAWSLTGTIKELGTSYFLVNAVSDMLPYWLLPTLIFVIACIISFATGTSYGTMLIVTPLTVPIAYNLINMYSIGNAENYVLATIGAVLSGAIFGDHCSPISDTTILSSMGAGVDHMDHVRTQMVYSLFIAAIAIVTGTLLSGFGVSAWISLSAGVLVTVVLLRLIGKNPDIEAAKIKD